LYAGWQEADFKDISVFLFLAEARGKGWCPFGVLQHNTHEVLDNMSDPPTREGPLFSAGIHAPFF